MTSTPTPHPHNSSESGGKKERMTNEELLRKVDELFEFKIGDEVTTKSDSTGTFPTLLRIGYRFLEECPGGVQRHYKCRQHFADGAISTGMIDFNENEIRACSFEKTMDASFQTQVRRAEVMKTSADKIKNRIFDERIARMKEEREDKE